MSTNLSAEWIVRAKCVVTKEFVIRGTKEEAEALDGEILDELELAQVDYDVLSVKPNT